MSFIKVHNENLKKHIHIFITFKEYMVPQHIKLNIAQSLQFTSNRSCILPVSGPLKIINENILVQNRL